MKLFLSLFLFFSLSLMGQATTVNTVMATIPVGVTPAGLAVTPDNLYAYVANNNNYTIANQDTVSVLDLTNNLLKTTISDASFNEPYTVTINAAGTKAYVTNSNSSTITIINIPANTIAGTITGFDGPSGMVITPDGTKAYVNNYGGPGGVGSGNGTTVSVVDLNSNAIIGSPITVGQAPAALTITPDGNYVYVANYVDGNQGTGTVSVIATGSNTVVHTITGFSGPFAIEVTPNGKFAYVTNFGSNNFEPFGTTVSVIDLSNNTIIATVNVGIQPSGLAITSDSNYAYVSNYNTLYQTPGFTGLTAGEGTINIINTATNEVIPPVIPVGQSPSAVAISPNGEFAYVSNYTSNTVKVIALPNYQIVAQGCQVQNKYFTQLDLVNKITWTVSGTSLPVSYAIYRDAGLTDLAGTVLATQPFIFLDHNRSSNVAYTYYLVGVDSFGNNSLPVVITVTQPC